MKTSMTNYICFSCGVEAQRGPWPLHFLGF